MKGKQMTTFKLETLESLMNFNKEYAKTIYKKEGQILPMFVGYTKNNSSRIIIAGAFSNNEEKESWCTLARCAFLKCNVDKYVFRIFYVLFKNVCFCHTHVEKPEDIYKKYKSIKDHPNRKEALTIIAVNRYGAKMSSTIIENGTLKETEIKSNGTYKDVGGRMTELEVVEKYNNSPELKLLIDQALKIRVIIKLLS